MTPSVLIIDDDPGIRRLLERALAGIGIEAVLADGGQAGIDLFELTSFELVLLDLELPDLSGLDVLRALKKRDPTVGVVMMTGHGDIPTAVDSIHLGADHFLTKPIDLEQLGRLAGKIVETVRLRRRNEHHAERASDTYRLGALGESPAMQSVIDAVDTLSATDAILLLRGETGVGKGWTAELIHSLSARARGAFVAVNCAGLAGPTLAAELFGEDVSAGRKGRDSRAGLLEEAHGGTLFLDEIGELAPELQPKLLQVLDTGRLRRLGSAREIDADIRLIAATRTDLRQAVERGTLREDLYWRIAAHPIHLPPLRERGPDAIVEMAYRLLENLRRRLGRGPTRIAPSAMQRLVQHHWPGNIRELSNVLEHVILRAGAADEVLPRHLPAHLVETGFEAGAPAQVRWNLATAVDAAERHHIEAALDATGGVRSRAASLMGISRATLYEKLKKHGIDG